jgi:hypothetical protein
MFWNLPSYRMEILKKSMSSNITYHRQNPIIQVEIYLNGCVLILIVTNFIAKDNES